MLKPHIGAAVLFYPDADSLPADGFALHDSGTYAGTIASLQSDTLVNLSVLDSDGVAHNVTAVPLVTVGDRKRPSGYWCELSANTRVHRHEAPVPVDPTAQRLDSPGWKDPNAPTV